MKKVLLFISLFLILLIPVKAEECSSQEKVEYMNDAVKVSASYEFKKDESGRTYFLITIYNLGPNISVYYTDENGMPQGIVGTDDTITESFTDYNIDTTFTYKFTVSIIGSNGCISKIKDFSLTKPKKNYYYENIPECKFEKMKDYYYCKEWINNDFHIDQQVIIKNIKNEFNKTTTVISQETVEKDNLMSLLELYLKGRIYILIGLGIGILVDIVYIFLSYKRIKEGEF